MRAALEYGVDWMREDVEEEVRVVEVVVWVGGDGANVRTKRFGLLADLLWLSRRCGWMRRVRGAGVESHEYR